MMNSDNALYCERHYVVIVAQVVHHLDEQRAFIIGIISRVLEMGWREFAERASHQESRVQ
jgi:hypothetical protein